MTDREAYLLRENTRLEDLISLKLDSWSVNPTHRLKDKSDVVELIKNRKLPRELPVAAAVKQFYVETWDALRAEENPLL